MATKIYQWQLYIPNGGELDQMAIKFSNTFSKESFARHSEIYPNWDFRFENIPSGNPGGSSVPSFLPS
jgi:hypothetical protein